MSVSSRKIIVRPVGGEFRLYIRSVAGETVAGFRLMKGGEFPLERFSFPTDTEAYDAAIKLEEYVNNSVSKMSAKERRVETERRKLEAHRLLHS